MAGGDLAEKGGELGERGGELADLGKALGAEPPADLAALLAWHNGQDDDVFGGFVDDWRLMSAAQVATAKWGADE